VRCRADDPDDPSWLRFLLDTILWWVCLTKGAHILHASAVSISGRVYAFAGRTGGGKTSLAAALIRNGHALFSDDVIVLRRVSGSLVASPGPGLMNLPLGAGDPSAFGRPIATFAGQDETWISVHRVADAPAPISGIILLDRRADESLRMERMEATALDLLPYAWGLPQSSAREQFAVLSDLTVSTPIYQLFAGLDDQPGILAALVERSAMRGQAADGASDGSGAL
jgi:hypothetical protein